MSDVAAAVEERRTRSATKIVPRIDIADYRLAEEIRKHYILSVQEDAFDASQNVRFRRVRERLQSRLSTPSTSAHRHRARPTYIAALISLFKPSHRRYHVSA